MNLHEFLHLTYNLDNLINYLCEKQVIRREIECPRCKNVLRYNSESHDLIFKCTQKYYKTVYKRKRQRMTCNFSISILHGTWFAQFRLGLSKVCRFIGYFATLKNPEQAFLQSELEMGAASVVDWKNFCRELLLMWFNQEENIIGGPGCIVEIDEAKIGKRKYNRGRIVKGQWFFGAIERETKRIFIVPINDRCEATLLNIIRCRIAPGTTIHSDCWRAYCNLKNEGYNHLTINHSENFVDPITGVHTQNIERLWRDVYIRGGIPRYGTREEHYIYYIAEFMFKRIYNYSERIDQFFKIMSKLYPLTNNINNENE